MLEGMTVDERLVAGRYRLRALLGRGGMGSVWLADDEVLERKVAIKEVDLPPAAGSDEHDLLRERVIREARTAARLDHPNVVRIFDVAEDEDRPWIVMEVLTGCTLSEEVRDHGPLSPARAANVGLALLDALEAAHRVGVVHRDVKPANVQLCEGGRVVLTDFGIASSASDSSITRTGEVVGSPAYMSPERARGETLGQPSDLFSLGATLYHAVEGRPPFDRGTPLATLTAVVHDSPGPFASAGPLRPVLVGLLAKRPEERWEPARVRAALRQVADGLEVDEATQAVAALPSTESTQVLTPIQAEAALVSEDSVPVEVLRERVLDSGPPTDPGLQPLPAPRTGRVGWGVAALLVLVLAGLAGAGYALSQRDTNPGRSSSTTADGPFLPGQGSIPADWEVRENGKWSVATPPGWRKDGSRYRSAKGDTYAYINVSSTTDGTPREVLETASGTFADRDNHEDYSQVGEVTDLTFRGQDAAAWEFTYRDGDSVLLHARQLAYLSGGKVWILWWQTYDKDWDAQRALGDQIVSTFTPK